MRKLFLTLSAIFCLLITTIAQNRTITGRVTDADGLGVPRASVVVKGTRIGTTTNSEGNFTLSVPTNTRTLVITGIGYSMQEVAISGSTISISLQQDVNIMEQVVVTGYTREKKSQFSGAATVLGGKVVDAIPVGAFDQALQGRAPGLLVNSGTGQPGSSAQITIRGVQSISGAGAQPLFILDGVPLPAFDMQSINPNDFESITILKDASASALYGARGGTGVIVLTSKKGKTGPPQFTFRTQFGFTQRPDFSRLNMMNTSEILMYEERTGLQGAPSTTPGWVYSLKNPANAGLPVTGATQYAPSQTRYNFILDSIRGIDMNYANILYRQGFSQSHEIDVSGGAENTRFYLSAGIFNQQGIDLRSDLTRYTTRFNIENKLNKLTISLNTALGYSKNNYSEGEWLGNSPRNPFQMTYRAKPYENPYKADGSLNFGGSTSLNLKQIANLLEGSQNSTYRDNQFKANGSLSLAYKLIPSVTLKNTLGIDVSSNLWQKTIQAGSYYGSLVTFNAGEQRESYQLVSQLINTSSVVFSKMFNNKHEVETGAYFEIVRGKQKALGFTLFNLDPRLSETGQGAGSLPTGGAATYPQNASSAKSGFGIRSYFATARYTYNNKYTLNANVRRDGTSRIVNVDNREITTWSAGAIWNALKENFLSNQKVFSDLKLRVSYGIVPNIGSIATSSYGIGGGIVSVTNFQGPQVPSFGTTTYAGSTVTGLAPTSPGNPNLQIENIQKANIGIDFAMWNNRARFIVDVYKHKTIDLFVSQPLSGTTGFASTNINAGIMTNKGVEFNAAVDIVKNRDFTFIFGLNHAINKNNIEDLGLVNEYFLGTFVIRKGLPYGSHYTYHYLGADPTTGRPRYETADGKETLDIAQAGRFAKFGTYLPKHVGGFTTDFTYKQFSVSALFSYQFDVVRSDNTRSWITRGISGYYTSVNQSREMLTMQWQKPGDVAQYQSPLYDRDFTSSDLNDAKFLRFRTLTIAYELPKLTNMIKSGKFYVRAQNLAIWSPWKGIDPEDNNNISLNEYPNPKMMVVGLDINF